MKNKKTEKFDGLDTNYQKRFFNQASHPRISQKSSEELALGELSELLASLAMELQDKLADLEAGRGEDLATPADVFIDLALAPALAKTGGKRPLNYERLAKCNECAGRGSQAGKGLTTCRRCNGKGKLRAKTCSVCAGLGSYPEVNCVRCLGEGRVKAERQVDLLIPTKTLTGHTLRVAGGGHRHFRSDRYGDLYVNIKLTKRET